jgi:hypothetical protein
VNAVKNFSIRGGASRHRLYGTWRNMLDRCYKPSHRYFALYGGRGIEVCDRWRESPLTFYADMGVRLEGLTLERIDSDGDFEPGNCRWGRCVPQRANLHPRRSALPVAEIRALSEAGVSQKELARQFGVVSSTISRVLHGRPHFTRDA